MTLDYSMMQPLLLLGFGLPALYGFVKIVMSLRKIRAPRKYRKVLLTWAEHPSTVYRYELNSWVAVNIHRLALIAVGFIALAMIAFRPVVDFEIPGLANPIATIIYFPFLAVGVAFIGFMWGQSIFGPIAELIAGDSHYAISDDGILYSDWLFPWSAFSHFSMNVKETMIQIWSASFPGTVAFTLVPPSAEDVPKLKGILQSHLTTGANSPPGFIQRCAFPVSMAGISAVFITAAILTFKLSTSIALLLDTFFIYMLVRLGEKLIMRWIYGGKGLPAPIA
ncbi:MAG: hypothetical protein WBV22_05120 [Anaerolineaceae bacterium]